MASYSLAMTQWHPILAQFAAVDLRTFSFLKVRGIESKNKYNIIDEHSYI